MTNPLVHGILVLTQWAHHIESTSIPHGYYVDTSKSKFHFHVLFRCNFADRKIDIVSRYFLGAILLVKIWTLFPHTFFDVILMVEKSTLFAHTFLNENLTGRKSTSLLVRLQANENIWGSFTLLVTVKSWILQDYSP